ncbi:uncharacterized protein TNCV_1604291 [Trichonephila clavipes]|nr:uncharacterized protein TNCV_1604291 [Trichonephila clavipes]
MNHTTTDSVRYASFGVHSYLTSFASHHNSRIRVRIHRGERLLSCCVMHHSTGPAPGIMIWRGIGFYCRTTLVRIAGTLNCQPYISEVLQPVVHPYIQRLP